VTYVAAGNNKGKTKLVSKATRIATDKIRDAAKGLRKEKKRRGSMCLGFYFILCFVSSLKIVFSFILNHLA